MIYSKQMDNNKKNIIGSSNTDETFDKIQTEHITELGCYCDGKAEKGFLI